MARKKKLSSEDIDSELMEFYGGEDIPAYVVNASEKHITLTVGDVITDDSKELKITIPDVVEYYKTQAPNFMSGCRKLAGHIGDWRPIDNMANECLEWFKHINKDGLRKAAIKAGLEPKF